MWKVEHPLGEEEQSIWSGSAGNLKFPHSSEHPEEIQFPRYTPGCCVCVYGDTSLRIFKSLSLSLSYSLTSSLDLTVFLSLSSSTNVMLVTHTHTHITQANITFRLFYMQVKSEHVTVLGGVYLRTTSHTHQISDGAYTRMPQL